MRERYKQISYTPSKLLGTKQCFYSANNECTLESPLGNKRADVTSLTYFPLLY